MTYLEHLELSEQYREQAMEALHRANSREFAPAFNEYVRLSKLANKHWGIYQMVCTQRRNRNAYRTITVHEG